MEKEKMEQGVMRFVFLGTEPVTLAKYRTDDGQYSALIDGDLVELRRRGRKGAEPAKYQRLEDLPDSAKLIQVSMIFKMGKVARR